MPKDQIAKKLSWDTSKPCNLYGYNTNGTSMYLSKTAIAIIIPIEELSEVDK